MLALVSRAEVREEKQSYPCLDALGHYRSFPCSRCPARGCWAGEKPAGPPPELSLGQRRCEHCGGVYSSRGRKRYCSDICRYREMMRRRRRRRVGGEGLPHGASVPLTD